MIRVIVQLIPKGDEARARELGRMEIANDASGDFETGNYNGTLHAEYTGAKGRTGRVKDFHRQRQSVWSLVGAFLKLWGHTKHSPAKMSTKVPFEFAEANGTDNTERQLPNAQREKPRVLVIEEGKPSPSSMEIVQACLVLEKQGEFYWVKKSRHGYPRFGARLTCDEAEGFIKAMEKWP